MVRRQVLHPFLRDLDFSAHGDFVEIPESFDQKIRSESACYSRTSKALRSCRCRKTNRESSYQDRTGIRRSLERKESMSISRASVFGVVRVWHFGESPGDSELHRPYEYRVEDEGMQSPQ